jgi:hypothetical protein
MFALRQRLGSESVAGVAIERLSDADREARPEEKNPTKEAHNPHQALKKNLCFPSLNAMSESPGPKYRMLGSSRR